VFNRREEIIAALFAQHVADEATEEADIAPQAIGRIGGGGRWLGDHGRLPGWASLCRADMVPDRDATVWLLLRGDRWFRVSSWNQW
jgi:hypothetical protein